MIVFKKYIFNFEEKCNFLNRPNIDVCIMFEMLPSKVFLFRFLMYDDLYSVNVLLVQS